MLLVSGQSTEVACQTLNSTTSMTESVLLLLCELSEGLRATLGTEDRIIAEAVRPRAFQRNFAIDRPLKEVRPIFVDEGNDRTEARLTWSRYTVKSRQE